MNYRQCLRYLERIQNLGIKFGLNNVRTILASLDNPQQKYPSILVAGTNGKGSVCAMLLRILSLHGFKAGLFTSPHLVQIEERIRIGENLISKGDFSRLLTVLREKIEELITKKKLSSPPTFFELLTCLALLYFKEKDVDMAILEVGMGGRYDATNTVLPCVCVITSISLEHQKFLGETLQEIAFEKAGIIKPGVPVVCGDENVEALETIKRRAGELKSPFIGVFSQKGCFKVEKGTKSYSFEYRSNGEKFSFSPSLAGWHQGKNAAIAIVASEQISKKWKKLQRDKITRGIETVRWEGRLEILSHEPLVIVDGAHNEEGAKALRRYVQDFLSSPLTLIFAIMRDKKIEDLAEILFPLAERIILTRFPYYRAALPEEIRERAAGYQEKITLVPNVKQAVRIALQKNGPHEAILVAGSLFLVGEVKKAFPH